MKNPKTHACSVLIWQLMQVHCRCINVYKCFFPLFPCVSLSDTCVLHVQFSLSFRSPTCRTHVHFLPHTCKHTAHPARSFTLHTPQLSRPACLYFSTPVLFSCRSAEKSVSKVSLEQQKSHVQKSLLTLILPDALTSSQVGQR